MFSRQSSYYWSKIFLPACSADHQTIWHQIQCLSAVNPCNPRVILSQNGNSNERHLHFTKRMVSAPAASCKKGGSWGGLGANLPWVHPLLSATSSGVLVGSENLNSWNKIVVLMTQTVHHTKSKEWFHSGGPYYFHGCGEWISIQFFFSNNRVYMLAMTAWKDCNCLSMFN